MANRLQWRLQKYQHLIHPVLFRQVPAFVYAKSASVEKEIPVFTFHTALPDEFEAKCRHLVRNGYQTLTADEFYRAIEGSTPLTQKSVFLTFDDGLKHMWTVAYPLLKKYGLKATCFLIPGCIPGEEGIPRQNLEDFWQGHGSLDDIMALGRGPMSLANWAEIKIMHESGVIDFQSHTFFHHLVPVSDEIFGFMHPRYNTHFYGNIHVPFYRENGQDATSRKPIMGMPLYKSKPRMQAKRRYFDDEHLRHECAQWVREKGGDAFFNQPDWEKDLRKFVAAHKKKASSRGRYESESMRDQDILNDLEKSKECIERKLPGKRVDHLCYPWYQAEEFVVALSKKAGFKTNYFGPLKDVPANCPGNDPYHVSRIEGEFVERLPGVGRVGLGEICKRFFQTKNLPQIMKITGTN